MIQDKKDSSAPSTHAFCCGRCPQVLSDIGEAMTHVVTAHGGRPTVVRCKCTKCLWMGPDHLGRRA